MPRLTIEFNGAFVHCTPQQLRPTLEALQIWPTTPTPTPTQATSTGSAPLARRHTPPASLSDDSSGPPVRHGAHRGARKRRKATPIAHGSSSEDHTFSSTAPPLNLSGHYVQSLPHTVHRDHMVPTPTASSSTAGCSSRPQHTSDATPDALDMQPQEASEPPVGPDTPDAHDSQTLDAAVVTDEALENGLHPQRPLHDVHIGEGPRIFTRLDEVGQPMHFVADPNAEPDAEPAAHELPIQEPADVANSINPRTALDPFGCHQCSRHNVIAPLAPTTMELYPIPAQATNTVLPNAAPPMVPMTTVPALTTDQTLAQAMTTEQALPPTTPMILPTAIEYASRLEIAANDAGYATPDPSDDEGLPLALQPNDPHDPLLNLPFDGAGLLLIADPFRHATSVDRAPQIKLPMHGVAALTDLTRQPTEEYHQWYINMLKKDQDKSNACASAGPSAPSGATSSTTPATPGAQVPQSHDANEATADTDTSTVTDNTGAWTMQQWRDAANASADALESQPQEPTDVSSHSTAPVTTPATNEPKSPVAADTSTAHTAPDTTAAADEPMAPAATDASMQAATQGESQQAAHEAWNWTLGGLRTEINDAHSTAPPATTPAVIEPHSPVATRSGSVVLVPRPTTPDWQRDYDADGNRTASWQPAAAIESQPHAATDVAEVSACHPPRGRCMQFCDRCRRRPCMLAEGHFGSGPPFGYCLCPMAQRGENCNYVWPNRLDAAKHPPAIQPAHLTWHGFTTPTVPQPGEGPPFDRARQDAANAHAAAQDVNQPPPPAATRVATSHDSNATRRRNERVPLSPTEVPDPPPDTDADDPPAPIAAPALQPPQRFVSDPLTVLLDRQTEDAATALSPPATPDSSQAAAGCSIASLSSRIAVLQRRYMQLCNFPALNENHEVSRIRVELIALLNQRAHLLRVARAQ